MKNKLVKVNGFMWLFIVTLLTYNAWRDGQNLTFYFILWGIIIILFPTLRYIRNMKNKESK